MKALLIGGTGQISLAITKELVQNGWEVYLLNRGNRNHALPEGVRPIVADINDEETVLAKTEGMEFDCVCEFIGRLKEHVVRDVRLFNGRCRQYIFISSASVYHKPVESYIIREGTTIANPYWDYAQNKIACENYLMEQFRGNGFPVTIVRPSHTYDERRVPLALQGKHGCWQVIRRMQQGKPVIIPGDGTSLWTVTTSADFAKGYVGLMGNRHALGEVFHITSDETLTWNQIYETIADALGVRLNPYHVASDFLAAVGKEYGYSGSLMGDKACSVVFDNTKIKEAVPGYKATIPFHIGARFSIGHMLAHPELQVEDPEFDLWCDRVIAGLEQLKGSLA